MPRITFSIDEIVQPLLKRSRDLSTEVLELSDLAKKPLDPGESPDARRHKIAKLGKQLAETFLTLDSVMQEAAKGIADDLGLDADTTPTPTEPSQAN